MMEEKPLVKMPREDLAVIWFALATEAVKYKLGRVVSKFATEVVEICKEPDNEKTRQQLVEVIENVYANIGEHHVKEPRK